MEGRPQTPHTVPCHAVRLPLGALRIWWARCGPGGYTYCHVWQVDNGVVSFASMEDEAAPKQSALPSSQLIQETLAYAKELERIV